MSMVIYIINGMLVDGLGVVLRVGVDVVIDGDFIVVVGAFADVVFCVLVVVRVVDAMGLLVLFGLIDAHCYIIFDDVWLNDELFFYCLVIIVALLIVFNLRKFLLVGVMLIMDFDMVMGIGLQVCDVVDSGVFDGSCICMGVQVLFIFVGGIVGCLIFDIGEVGYAAVVNIVYEMVIIIWWYIKYGVDWIKIHVMGLIFIQRGELQVWKRDEMKVVCEIVYELGVFVMVYCCNVFLICDAAWVGVDLILYVLFIDDEGFQVVIDQGVAICFMFIFLVNLVDYGEWVGVGVGMREIFWGEIKVIAVMMRYVYDVGVLFLCGFESGFVLMFYGYWYVCELEVFVNELGLLLVEVIVCVTRNNVIVMRMMGQFGFVVEGYWVDVLVVDGDLVRDVTLFQDCSWLWVVISWGCFVDLMVPWLQWIFFVGEYVNNWLVEMLIYEWVKGFD